MNLKIQMLTQRSKTNKQKNPTYKLYDSVSIKFFKVPMVSDSFMGMYTCDKTSNCML